MGIRKGVIKAKHLIIFAFAWATYSRSVSCQRVDQTGTPREFTERQLVDIPISRSSVGSSVRSLWGWKILWYSSMGHPAGFEFAPQIFDVQLA